MLNTGVALADNAALTNPVNKEMRMIPNMIQKMQKARAQMDLGDRSPYLKVEITFSIGSKTKSDLHFELKDHLLKVSSVTKIQPIRTGRSKDYKKDSNRFKRKQ